MYQLANTGSFTVNPVEVAELLSAGVVVDIDNEELLQAAQLGTFQPVALPHDDCVVRSMHAHCAPNPVGSWKLAIDIVNSVGRHKISSLAHLLKQHTHRQRRSDSVTIWTGVRANQETLS